MFILSLELKYPAQFTLCTATSDTQVSEERERERERERDGEERQRIVHMLRGRSSVRQVSIIHSHMERERINHCRQQTHRNKER